MISPIEIVHARRRIAAIAATTPVEYSYPLSALSAAEVYIKLECAQVTGSFKIRGAANALLADDDRRPVVACSAGNHALGVAHAAALSGIAATLVLPQSASPAKVAGLRRYPVELLQIGATYDDAEAAALALAEERGARFVSPYNDAAVIAGQGTLGMELLEQLPQLEVLLVGVGGGGLIAGVALWARAINPHIRVIGVQAAHSAAMAASLQAGRIVTAPDLPTLADGLAGGIAADSITFPLVQQYVERIVTVSEAQIAAAMRLIFHEHHLVVEGSAAVGTAALMHNLIPQIAGRHVGILLCGRNVAGSVFQAVLNETAG